MTNHGKSFIVKSTRKNPITGDHTFLQLIPGHAADPYGLGEDSLEETSLDRLGASYTEARATFIIQEARRLKMRTFKIVEVNASYDAGRKIQKNPHE